MMIPLLHHGMVIAGLPYSQPELMSTSTGGSPYGVTHLAHADGSAPISADERKLAIAQGKRLAEIALKQLVSPDCVGNRLGNGTGTHQTRRFMGGVKGGATSVRTQRALARTQLHHAMGIHACNDLFH